MSSKGDVRHYKNAKGEGQLFSITLSDDSGDIRGTAFGDSVTTHYDNLSVGQTYFVSKAMVKIANKQWSNVDNDYEMSFDANTMFVPCEGDNVGMKYKFVELSKLGEMNVGAFVDLLVVVKEVSESQPIMSKKQVEVTYF